MSKWRVIRRLPGAPGVLIYLCGPGGDADHDGIGDLDEAIAEALPGFAIAATGDNGYGAPIHDVDLGLGACGGASLVALAGFSAGCQGVRQQLWNGLAPAVVLNLDGTSGPWPLPEGARELKVWRDYAAAGGKLIMTATSQRYTQRLPRGVPGQQGPFAATSTVIARALGWPEAEALAPLTKALDVYPGLPALELHRDNVHAFIFRGTDCDARAHSAQLVHVLPEMLRRYVGEGEVHWTLGGSLAQLTSDLETWASDVWGAMFESEAGGYVLPPRPLGERAVEWARGELAAGVKEKPGPAANERIQGYLSRCRRGGSPLAGMPGHEREGSSTLGDKPSDEIAWCAAGASESILCSLAVGETPPHGHRAAVAEVCADLKVAGRLHVKGSGYQPKIGDYVLSGRAGGNPLKGGSGHIERVSRLNPLWTIGGNESNQWIEAPHAGEQDPSFAAWGEV